MLTCPQFGPVSTFNLNSMTAPVYVVEKGLFRHFWLTTRFFDVLLRPTKVRLLCSKYLRGFNLPQNILKIWFRDLGHVSEKKMFRLKNHVKWPQFCSTIFSLKIAKTVVFWKFWNRFLCVTCVQILFFGVWSVLQRVLMPNVRPRKILDAKVKN